MRLGIEQLGAALKRGLAPIYVITGDEPLQLGEAADAVRGAARVAGFTHREVFHADGAFDWNAFREAADSLPLFDDRRVLDLRLPSGNPDAEGAEALVDYARRVPDDTVLLLTAGKLGSSAGRASWYQALDKHGVVVQVRTPDGQALVEWLARRMSSRGLSTDRSGLRILASRVEGNLLAAAQEIDKLFVLNGPGPVDADTILNAVADSARFDVFDLVDAALAGNGERALRVLEGLKAEAEAPPVVLWALAREARLLSSVLWMRRGGMSHDAALRKHKVWDARKPTIVGALRRLNQSDLFDVLALCARTDRTIKGIEGGDPWDLLLGVSMRIAGVKLDPGGLTP